MQNTAVENAAEEGAIIIYEPVIHTVITGSITIIPVKVRIFLKDYYIPKNSQLIITNSSGSVIVTYNVSSVSRIYPFYYNYDWVITGLPNGNYYLTASVYVEDTIDFFFESFRTLYSDRIPITIQK